MNLNRRTAIALGAGTLAATAFANLALAQAAAPAGATTETAPGPMPGTEPTSVDAWISDFTGGVTPTEGGITLTTPEIAENGNTVPVAVDAEGASEVLLLATGNPVPGITVARFGAAAANRKLATRIRLAKTQDVVAVAKMEDGSFRTVKNNVKVTVGGCGG